LVSYLRSIAFGIAPGKRLIDPDFLEESDGKYLEQSVERAVQVKAPF
jgi:hypothetical protein